jgi:hypothetical protein
VIFLRLDENVSHRIADAAERIGIPQGLQIEHPHRTKERGMKDIPWIKAYAARGKRGSIRVVFSADENMRFNEPERLALQEAGLIVFFAPIPWWRGLHRQGQAAFFLRWMLRMVEVAKVSAPGDQFRLPDHFRVDVALKPLPRVGAEARRRRRQRRPPEPGKLI